MSDTVDSWRGCGSFPKNRCLNWISGSSCNASDRSLVRRKYVTTSSHAHLLCSTSIPRAISRHSVRNCLPASIRVTGEGSRSGTSPRQPRRRMGKPFFRRMRDEVAEGVEQCRRACAYFEVCGGGAPSNKLFENGSFASTETRHCAYTRKAVIDITLEFMESQMNTWRPQSAATIGPSPLR